MIEVLELTSLICNSSSAAAKEALTIYVENRTDELIKQCLADGTQLDMMRDLWYEMKDDPIVRAGQGAKRDNETEEEYSDKITAIIRNEFAKKAEEDPSIYTRLGLHSRVLVKGEVPIVVIFEKTKKVAIPVVEEFHAGYAFASGQFPTFESVHVANYFNECGYSKGYVFVVSDYDPAGEDLYRQVRQKMSTFSNIDVEVNWVAFGSDPIAEFESYELANNRTNKKWIEDGHTRGVEFNTPTNIRNGILSYLKKSILDHVDPRYYVLHSYNEWVEETNRELASEDATYQEWKGEVSKLHTLMNERRGEYGDAVSRIETDYYSETNHIDGYINLSDFTTLTSPREDCTNMLDEDIEYYYDLLGSKSPYSDDLEQDEFTDEELQTIMADYAEEEDDEN